MSDEISRAREELREADLSAVRGVDTGCACPEGPCAHDQGVDAAYEAIRATALEATPLQDRINVLEASQSALAKTAGAHQHEGNGKWIVPLADEIARLKAVLNELRAWQIAVAEGMGYVNRAEGQDGCEVAEPSVILGAWNEAQQLLTLTDAADGADQEELKKTQALIESLRAELAAESKLVSALQEQLAAEKLAHLETKREQDQTRVALERLQDVSSVLRLEAELTAARADAARKAEQEVEFRDALALFDQACRIALMYPEHAGTPDVLRRALGQLGGKQAERLITLGLPRSHTYKADALSDSSALEWLAARERKVAERVREACAKRISSDSSQFDAHPKAGPYFEGSVRSLDLDALLKETP